MHRWGRWASTGHVRERERGQVGVHRAVVVPGQAGGREGTGGRMQRVDLARVQEGWCARAYATGSQASVDEIRAAGAQRSGKHVGC